MNATKPYLTKKFKKSPRYYQPIDWSGKAGAYESSTFYDDLGWVHKYRDVQGEKTRNAYVNAQALSEDRKFNNIFNA